MAIKIEKDDIFGLSHAIRGLRNPMNSWEKSDSVHCTFESYGHCSGCDLDGYCTEKHHNDEFVIGKKDHALMQRLVKAGSDHSKFMRMITVYMDITAPLYWWKEFDTYKVGTVANSCSTMHKIHAKEFELDDFSHEHLTPLALSTLERVVDMLNNYRADFTLNKMKDDWWQMIQLLPSSYNQKRTVMLNYAVLRNMYHARKNHKLDEWRKFCEWVEMLPYSELITEDFKNGN
jgi:hypothetical protein